MQAMSAVTKDIPINRMTTAQHTSPVRGESTQQTTPDAASPTIRGSRDREKTHPAGADVIVDVECGLNKGVLYLNKLSAGSKGACVLFDNAWLTPNEFQYVSGRETAKDWKRSIKHHGKSLKLLIAKGVMTSDPAVCKCEACVIPDSASAPEGAVTDKHDQENVPPSQLTNDLFVSSPEANSEDKDRSKAEVTGSHMTGSAGSESKAVADNGSRSVLKNMPGIGESFGDKQSEVPQKSTKKRKSQSKGEENKKSRKKSSVFCGTMEDSGLKVLSDDFNGGLDQLPVLSSISSPEDSQETTSSLPDLSPIQETASSLADSESRSMLSAKAPLVPEVIVNDTSRGDCVTESAEPAHHPVNTISSQVHHLTETENVARECRGFVQSSTASFCRIRETFAKNKCLNTSDCKANDEDEKLSAEAMEDEETLCHEISRFSDTHTRMPKDSVSPTNKQSPSSVDVTCQEPDITAPLLTHEAEVTESFRSLAPKIEDRKVKAHFLSSPIADRVDATSNCVKIEKVDSKGILDGMIPRGLLCSTELDDLNGTESMSDSDDELLLSPRKEARLTNIIAQLKTYKEHLIKRIEGSKTSPDEADEDSPSKEGTREGVAEELLSEVQIPAVVKAEPQTSTETHCDGKKTTEQQKCQTLFEILSSGSIPDVIKQSEKANPEDVQVPIPQPLVDSQPLRSSFQKPCTEKKSDIKKRVKECTEHHGKDRKPEKSLPSPPPGLLIPTPIAPFNNPMLSPIPALSGNMFMAPPFLPFPYGIPPAYLFPRALYAGFPFAADPTAIYKSLGCAAQAVAMINPPTSATHSSMPSQSKSVLNPQSTKKQTRHKPLKKVNGEGSPKIEGSHTQSSVLPDKPTPHHLNMFSPFTHSDVSYLTSNPMFTSKQDDTNIPQTTNSSSLDSSSVKSAFRPVKDKRTLDLDNHGVLDLSLKRPCPSLLSHPSHLSKQSCVTDSRFSSYKNGMVLDLSKTSAR